MPTIREWLMKNEFNFETGVILYQESRDASDMSDTSDLNPTVKINDIFINSIIDVFFSDQYGAAECPRFIAYDDKYLYFPEKYDGATSLCKILKNPEDYIGNTIPTPYPGGG
jgi:hypothetical protein